MLTKLKFKLIIELDEQVYKQANSKTEEYIWDEITDAFMIQGFMLFIFLIESEIG